MEKIGRGMFLGDVFHCVFWWTKEIGKGGGDRVCSLEMCCLPARRSHSFNWQRREQITNLWNVNKLQKSICSKKQCHGSVLYFILHFILFSKVVHLYFISGLSALSTVTFTQLKWVWPSFILALLSSLRGELEEWWESLMFWKELINSSRQHSHLCRV